VYFNSELWVDLPADMTPVFEEALMTLTYGLVVFDTWPQYEYTVGVSPPQTNRHTGTVKRTR
jgi:hypothetical protein